MISDHWNSPDIIACLKSEVVCYIQLIVRPKICHNAKEQFNVVKLNRRKKKRKEQLEIIKVNVFFGNGSFSKFHNCNSYISVKS